MLVVRFKFERANEGRFSQHRFGFLVRSSRKLLVPTTVAERRRYSRLVILLLLYCTLDSTVLRVQYSIHSIIVLAGTYDIGNRAGTTENNETNHLMVPLQDQYVRMKNQSKTRSNRHMTTQWVCFVLQWWCGDNQFPMHAPIITFNKTPVIVLCCVESLQLVAFIAWLLRSIWNPGY